MDTTRLRNIGIIAHIDAGKTTTTERMLYFSGKNHSIGEVDEGTATMDWMSQEQDRGITITSAATTFPWNDVTVNLIDTPGHIDFTAEVERSLRILDGAVAILCAVGGVEPQTETVWHQSNEYGIPRMVYINKMDRIGADFETVCSEVTEKLHCTPLPLQIPIGKEDSFEAVIDVVEQVELHWEKTAPHAIVKKDIRDSYADAANHAQTHLFETLSEYDDAIAELYLDNKEIKQEQLVLAIRKATLALKVVPVFVGASLKNIGVQPILDAVCNFLPAPTDRPTFAAIDKKENKTITKNADEYKELLALVFKIQHDREAGRICFIRVYSGSINAGSQIYLASNTKKERVTRILRMHANKPEQIRTLESGDIGALVGCKQAITGDTISLKPPRYFLEAMHFPEPVITSAIEAETYSKRKELMNVLGLLASEDPTLSWKDDTQSGQLIIAGMGELHLEVISKRIIDEYGISVRLGNPHVQLRETIKNTADGSFSDAISISGKLYPVSIELNVERNTTINLSVTHALENIPKEIVDACLETIYGYLQSGISLGYPGIYIAVHIKNLVFDPESYSLAAIQSALVQCLGSVCQKAGEQLLEPIMHVSIITPKDYLGEVTQSIARRGGTVTAIESHLIHEIIHAEAPLRIMFGYTTALRSVTQGRGSVSLVFSHFAPKTD